MEYARTFHLQVAHFNNSLAYVDYEKAEKIINEPSAWRIKSAESLWEAGKALLAVMKNTHGHNLKIEIKLDGPLIKPEGWVGAGMVVDDADLEELVIAWDNTNLSVLPEFIDAGKRATTEEIAETLAEKIAVKWPNLCKIQVSVWETPLIAATTKRDLLQESALKEMIKTARRI